ncbi:hypothetical protein [Bacillus sp. AFS029533]|uniref:hypothetical protein n=1 Tax=Bacillus sp. AFS029533 TaxID=2033494 RepID=UPI000BFCFF64|nr:hypothetical protein [Bacillus sp. AFS029533]PGZ92214.1 hypothetical protein COE53_12685 [Bacillus sp. AFS029533]
MSLYWAKFEVKNNHLCRFNTRVYLKPILYPSDKDICIGAVVGKNPGSAKPYDNNSPYFQKIQLENDKLMINVKSIFVKAFEKAKKPIPSNSYVQILNLFYICERNLKQAIKKIDVHTNMSICGTEEKYFPFIWYVWGSENKKLNFYKSRIYNIKSDEQFYLDTNTKKVITAAPRLSDSARHTQGMKHDLIVPFISTIL